MAMTNKELFLQSIQDQLKNVKADIDNTPDTGFNNYQIGYNDGRLCSLEIVLHSFEIFLKDEK